MTTKTLEDRGVSGEMTISRDCYSQTCKGEKRVFLVQGTTTDNHKWVYKCIRCDEIKHLPAVPYLPRRRFQI